MTTTLPDMTSAVQRVRLAYTVEPGDDEWDLPEGTVPESVPHSDASFHLRDVLSNHYADDPDTVVAQNLAIRWNVQRPAAGVDPDVCVLRPAPPDGRQLQSLKLWQPGVPTPAISFEIVSKNHPHKDYSRQQDGHSFTGVRELVIHDPHGYGPRTMGGPKTLHLWRRQPEGSFVRVAFGDGPVFSEVLAAWIIPDGNLLQIADESDGSGQWKSTAELRDEQCERANQERERADQERERADQERERADRLASELAALRLEK